MKLLTTGGVRIAGWKFSSHHRLFPGKEEDCRMRWTKLLFTVLWFMAVGQGQNRSDLCQERCENSYNVCTSSADQQLSDCLANVISCNGGCDKGCPSGTPSGPPPEPGQCPTNQQCYSNYNAAVASCDANYSICSSSCVDQVPPGLVSRRLIKPPCTRPSDATWALLLHNLSGPEKLKVPL